MADKKPANKKKREPPNQICTKPIQMASKQGTFGDPVTLLANYFKLTKVPNWTLNQYRVDISPEEERTQVRKGLLFVHKDKLGSYLFDGTVLFTCHALQQPLEFKSVKEGVKEPIVIRIKLTSTVQYGDYHYFQVFNIIMRKCFERLQLTLVGRNYYNPNQGIDVAQYMLKVWPGYQSTIGQFEAGVMMCSDISHKVMSTKTIYVKLDEIRDKFGNNFIPAFKRDVIGLVVITEYNHRTYKITDVDFDCTPESTFQKRDGSSTTYAFYYKDKYNINIKNMTQPLLVSKSSARDRRAGLAELVYLIPELCFCTGINEEMRKDYNIMRALASYTRVSPSNRIDKLMEFNRLLNTKEVRSDLKQWDLQLDTSLVKVQGRLHPMPRIAFGKQIFGEVKNGEWDLHRNPKPLINPGTEGLREWVIFFPARFKDSVQNFFKSVVGIAGKMGFKINIPKMCLLENDLPHNYVHAIDVKANETCFQTIVCVVPNNSLERYKAIKKKCLVDRATPTQVVLAKTLNHKNASAIACKVAIQMNCKLGGIPWTTNISADFRKLMVVGFDVCHEKVAGGKDFGAMVSSLEDNFGRYYSAVTHHSVGEELSDCLANNIGNSCKQYFRNNNCLPHHIIVYRDGVGEGQVPFVKDYEVEHMLEKLKKIYDCPTKNSTKIPLRFCFIIVTKRINTRLFYNRGNPPSGTVVDDVITNPLQSDFYMVSQDARQGTVSPTHYNIIENTAGFSADKIQKITYKFCHMYFNFNGAVAVPAPCQYAHKLAKLISQAVQQPVNENLNSTLYFL